MGSLPRIMGPTRSRSWETEDRKTKTQSVSSEPGVLESWRAGMDERFDGSTVRPTF